MNNLNNLDQLNKRISKLERNNKRLVTALMIGVLSAVLFAPLQGFSNNHTIRINDSARAITINNTPRTATDALKRIGTAKIANYQGKIVVADGFIVADPFTRKELIKMYRNPETRMPAFEMYDQKGALRATLAFQKDGMSEAQLLSLKLHGTYQGQTTQLLTLSDLPSIHIQRGDSTLNLRSSRLRLNSERGTANLQLHRTEGPELKLTKP